MKTRCLPDKIWKQTPYINTQKQDPISYVLVEIRNLYPDKLGILDSQYYQRKKY